MLLIFRPAQTGRQLQIAEDIVIGLAERGIGIQRIGILAQKIIVPLIVQMRDRVGIDIGASVCRGAVLCGANGFTSTNPPGKTFAIVGNAGNPWRTVLDQLRRRRPLLVEASAY